MRATRPTGVTLTERVRPVRTCVACRRPRPQHHLVRIARTPDGPRLDVRRHLEGRGAYVCPTEECVGRLEHRGSQVLRRALRCGPDDDVRPALVALRALVEPTATADHGVASGNEEQSE